MARIIARGIESFERNGQAAVPRVPGGVGVLNLSLGRGVPPGP